MVKSDGRNSGRGANRFRKKRRVLIRERRIAFRKVHESDAVPTKPVLRNGERNFRTARPKSHIGHDVAVNCRNEGYPRIRTTGALALFVDLTFVTAFDILE